MKKKVLLILGLCFSLFLANLIPFHSLAASKRISNGEDGITYTFAVPQNGWNTIRVHVVYTEYYSSNGSSNNFYQREKYVEYAVAKTDGDPKIRLDNVAHYNSAGDRLEIFSSWNRFDILYDSTIWDVAFAYRNTTSSSYSKETSAYGMLSFAASCEGGFIPIQADSLTLGLGTN